MSTFYLSMILKECQRKRTPHARNFSMKKPFAQINIGTEKFLDYDYNTFTKFAAQ